MFKTEKQVMIYQKHKLKMQASISKMNLNTLDLEQLLKKKQNFKLFKNSVGGE